MSVTPEIIKHYTDNAGGRWRCSNFFPASPNGEATCIITFVDVGHDRLSPIFLDVLHERFKIAAENPGTPVEGIKNVPLEVVEKAIEDFPAIPATEDVPEIRL